VTERTGELAKANEELDRANQELKELSFTDALTRVRNRRYFSEVILDEVHRVLRKHDERSALSTEERSEMLVLIIDIDYFKYVNDTYGHLAGIICSWSSSTGSAACFGGRT